MPTPRPRATVRWRLGMCTVCCRTCFAADIIIIIAVWLWAQFAAFDLTRRAGNGREMTRTWAPAR
jgi:hypothetical protein